jgi:protein O-mannosyl-transferase
LSACHVFSPLTSLLDLPAAAAVAFVVLMLGILVYAVRRMPLVSFCIAWVFITLLPVMDIYAVGRNVFAERCLYLPSVGFCLLIALAAGEVLQKIPVRRRTIVGFSALAAVVVTLGSMTFARNYEWLDDATLFASTLETSPNAPLCTSWWRRRKMIGLRGTNRRNNTI